MRKGTFCFFLFLLLTLLFLLFLGRVKPEPPADVRQRPGCNVTEETVCIEGLSKEYDLLFLTDSHVVIPDEDAEEAVAEYAGQRYPTFVNKDGVDARTQFEALIDYANDRKVDAVLLGGDIIDAPSEADLAFLEEQLDRLEMPCLYVPGNHDWTYPWEYMTQAGREEYLPRLEPFMQGNTAFQLLDFGEFRIVGVNDSANRVEGAALSGFERLYGEGEPMIVMTHVPFLTQSVLSRAREVWSGGVVIGGGAYGGIYPDETSQRFLELLTAQDSPVELVLAGHVHFYDRDVISGEKEVLQIVGAAGYEGNAILLHVRGREGSAE